jgi:hypothetical protein
MSFFVRLCVMLVAVSAANISLAAPPLKVFILAGQSNMEGQAVADLDGENYNDGRGTLNALLRDTDKAPLVKHLVGPDGKWSVRDDVWVRYQREDRPLLAGLRNRLAGQLADSVRTFSHAFQSVFDLGQFAAFDFCHARSQFVLRGVERGVDFIAALLQFAQQAQVAGEGLAQSVATLDENLAHLFQEFFACRFAHIITSCGSTPWSCRMSLCVLYWP